MEVVIWIGETVSVLVTEEQTLNDDIVFWNVIVLSLLVMSVGLLKLGVRVQNEVESKKNREGDGIVPSLVLVLK